MHSVLLALLVTSLCAASSVTDVVYYSLDFEWKPALCFGRTRCPVAFQTNDFNIHALVPYDSYHQRVLRCSSEPFALTSELDLSIMLPRDERIVKELYWKMEWDKHGTCMKTNDTPQQYFERILQLAAAHDPKAALYKHGIHPSSSQKYQKTQFLESFAHRIELECSEMRNHLRVLRLFFDLDFNSIDAPRSEVENVCGEEFELPEGKESRFSDDF